MKIQVTQEHIDKGKPNEMSRKLCPLALALKPFGVTEIRGVFNREVTLWSALRENGDLIPLPSEVNDWHDDLMADRDVKPFEFELSV